MAGIGSVLDIGAKALLAFQYAIQVTGSNIANVDTDGYSRQDVVLAESLTAEYGTGVDVEEVYRYFDEFIEEQYLDKVSDEARFETLYQALSGVDNLVNESNSEGLNTALAQFFADWEDLSLNPDDYSTREALISDTATLVSLLQSTASDLEGMQIQMQDYISQEVDTANTLIAQIAALNKQIGIEGTTGTTQLNALLDSRTELVRALAEKLDIETIDNGGGDFLVLTSAGQPLVDGAETYELTYEGPRTYTALTSASTYDGSINFDGSDSYEYTIEIVDGGLVSDASGTGATFKVSMDGGQTWLEDEDGNTLIFEATTENLKQTVGDLEIWFDTSLGSLAAGDNFTIVPKNGVYWYENTSTSVNITPQLYSDGTSNDRRISGGTIAGYVEFSDYYVGNYLEMLDGLAESLVWEINSLHSQGAGLDLENSVLGTYSVNDPAEALGTSTSGLFFGDRLEAGNAVMYMYDAATGELVNASNASGALDFSGTGTGAFNFDPETHSLNDVVTAINDTFGGYLTASIVNNQLRIEANEGYEFAFGTDTTGLWAALGVNTYFDGTDAGTITLNAEVAGDLDGINAGHVNGAGEANSGDNTTALAIASLAGEDVVITTKSGARSSMTLQEYYNTIVSKVGSNTASAEYNYEYQSTLAADLSDRQDEVSGVNLDEEMANLIKYQSSYQAAAKLITTADEMIQTILGLKS
ncbi:MAG: flagellar hook-associated protein FlgK [Desulfovibrionaceae bacterium]